MTTEWKPDICLYHAKCDDGYAAAWAVHRRWGDGVEYVPMHYGGKLPDIAGKHVLMVDFSLMAPAMREAAKVAASIVVLDHHETAEKELEMWTLPMAPALISFTNEVLEDIRARRPQEVVVAIFDMDKSGCRLAWEFCFPGEPIPRLLEHIEDRDLWRFALPYTKHVSAALRCYEHSFERFDEWNAPDAASLTALVLQGGAIHRAQEKRVADFLEQSYMAEVAGYTVPVLNVPYAYASECGHALLKKYPQAPFAATWSRLREGKIGWSLRSEDSREDVGKIAASFGGGGHRNASGFSLPVERRVMSLGSDGTMLEVLP